MLARTRRGIPVLVGTCVHVLLPPETTSHRRYFGLDYLEIIDTLSPGSFVPILSAVRACQSIRTVFLIDDSHRGLEVVHRRELWRWFVYAVFSRDSRHFFGIRPPSPAFVEDYASFQTPQRSTDGMTLGIPMRLRLSVSDSDAQKLAFMLRQILQLVIVQQSLPPPISMNKEEQDAWAASRFTIVELRLDQPITTPINLEGLQYLAQLSQLGIWIRDLPPIEESDASPPSRYEIAEALRVLISPSERLPCRPYHVYVSELSSPQFLPAVFSAIQTSKSVQCVHLRARPEPDLDEYGDEVEQILSAEEQEAERLRWRWAAYALFSLHAQHHVERVKIDCKFLCRHAISTMREMQSADHPLSLVLRMPHVDLPEWLSASKFTKDLLGLSPLKAPLVYELGEDVTVRMFNAMDRADGRGGKCCYPVSAEHGFTIVMRDFMIFIHIQSDQLLECIISRFSR